MSINIDLSGQTSLVTGGAVGFGRACAKALAAEGAAIVIAETSTGRVGAPPRGHLRQKVTRPKPLAPTPCEPTRGCAS